MSLPANTPEHLSQDTNFGTYQQFSAPRQRISGNQYDNTTQPPYHSLVDNQQFQYGLESSNWQRAHELATNGLELIQSRQRSNSRTDHLHPAVDERAAYQTHTKARAKPTRTHGPGVLDTSDPGCSPIFAQRQSYRVNVPSRTAQTTTTVSNVEYGHIAGKVIGPSVTFTPEADDGYQHPSIHFPSLTYIIHDSDSDIDESVGVSTSLPKHAHPQDTDSSQSIYQRVATVRNGTMGDFYRPNEPLHQLNAAAAEPIAIPSPLQMQRSTLQNNKRPIQHSSQSPQPTKRTKTGRPDKQPYTPYSRWSRTHLNRLTHQHQPRNLPDHVPFTDNTNVQDIPLRQLVPEYNEIEVDNEGDNVALLTGTRFEVPDPAGHRLGQTGIPDSIDVVESIEVPRQTAKRTPFKLVVKDEKGSIKVEVAFSTEFSGHDVLVGTETQGANLY